MRYIADEEDLKDVLQNALPDTEVKIVDSCSTCLGCGTILFRKFVYMPSPTGVKPALNLGHVYEVNPIVWTD